jgi:hypothetical protein
MPALRQKNTYSVLFYFVLFFVLASFIVRSTLLFLSFGKAEINALSLLQIFGKGLLFDIGVVSFFAVPYSIYLLLFPLKWSNTFVNRAITYTAFFLATFILLFSFFAEFTFWGEFESRFNFIAVDYLIYTYEVINNINQSYPLPLLLGGMLAITLMVIWFFNKRKYFTATFTGKVTFVNRLIVTFQLHRCMHLK